MGRCSSKEWHPFCTIGCDGMVCNIACMKHPWHAITWAYHLRDAWRHTITCTYHMHTPSHHIGANTWHTVICAHCHIGLSYGHTSTCTCHIHVIALSCDGPSMWWHGYIIPRTRGASYRTPQHKLVITGHAVTWALSHGHTSPGHTSPSSHLDTHFTLRHLQTALRTGSAMGRCSSKE